MEDSLIKARIDGLIGDSIGAKAKMAKAIDAKLPGFGSTSWSHASGAPGLMSP